VLILVSTDLARLKQSAKSSIIHPFVRVHQITKEIHSLVVSSELKLLNGLKTRAIHLLVDLSVNAVEQMTRQLALVSSGTLDDLLTADQSAL